MTVAELIAKLQTFPPDAKVRATPSDCCGCGSVAAVTVELNPDGDVYIDATKYA